MRRIPVLLSFLLLACITTSAQQQFLDKQFAQFLLQKYPGCIKFIPPNYDTIPEIFDSGYVFKSPICDAILNEDSLDVSGLGIEVFGGIQYFTSLKYLNASHNSIRSSPALPATVEYFDFSFNSYDEGPFSYIPPLPSSLLHLNIASLLSWNTSIVPIQV